MPGHRGGGGYRPAAPGVRGHPSRARRTPPFNARDRAVYNAGFGGGAALAGLGLALGDTRTLLYFVVADAASFLLAALAMSRLPRDRQAQPRDDRPDHAADGGYVGTLGALAHPRVFASGAVIGLLALPDEALDIGLPVWIAATHRAPFWLVGGALILNTMFVVGCQVPVARWLDRMSMTTNCYLSAAFLAAGFVLLAITGSLAASSTARPRAASCCSAAQKSADRL